MSAALGYLGAVVGYDAPVVTTERLDVCSGQVVGLIGPNGSGKTTLVRAATRSARVFSGAVQLLGRPVESYGQRELARNVGVLPQEVPAAFAFSARRFVEMGRHAYVSRFGDLGIEDRLAVDDAMELTDTVRLAEENVDTLSGGDLQRLTLAQALAQRPAVLLLDEPTSHLDLNHRLQVLDVVRSVAAGGVAAMVVFHDLDLAARYSDVLAVVADGRVAHVAPPEKVLTADTLSEVFGVKAVIGSDPVTGSVTVVPVMRQGAAAPQRGARVLVVSGAGTGAAIMRRLALAGYDVSAGALAPADVDHAVATALGAPLVELPPFGVMGPSDEEAVDRAARDADVVVVCSTAFGPGNVGNLRAVVSAGRPLVLIGEMGEDRDFTGGEARRLWDAAIAGGATTCRDLPGLETCVEGVRGK